MGIWYTVANVLGLACFFAGLVRVVILVLPMTWRGIRRGELSDEFDITWLLLWCCSALFSTLAVYSEHGWARVALVLAIIAFFWKPVSDVKASLRQGRKIRSALWKLAIYSGPRVVWPSRRAQP